MAVNFPPTGLVKVPKPVEVTIDHVPVPHVETPDPRIDRDRANQWPMDLEEAILIAVENSEVIRTTGNPRPGTRGVGRSRPRGTATAYDPAIAGTNVLDAMGEFDATIGASMFWERLENPPGQRFGGGNQPRRDDAHFRSFIRKPLYTGGNAFVAFNNDYFFIPPGFPQPGVNPQYQTHLEFGVSQPVLRGRGRAVNLAPLNIEVTDASRSAWEYTRQVMAMVRSVETSYWQLYATQESLRAVEQSLPWYREVVRVQKARVKADTSIPADEAQAEALYKAALTLAVQNEADVVFKQAQLLNLIGLPPVGDQRVEVATRPFRGRVAIDWDETLFIALNERPDVIRQRLSVHAAQLQLLIAHNGLLPQLDGQALWRINGLGEDLNQSLEVLGDSQFTDWHLGFVFRHRLGNHQAKAEYQNSELRFARSQAELRQVAHAASHNVADAVREVDYVYRQYEISRQRTKAARIWVDGAEARYLTPRREESQLQNLDNYLRAIRTWVAARQIEAALLARYNIALVQLEEAKGTLLATHNIVVMNDPCSKVASLELLGDYNSASFNSSRRGNETIEAPAPEPYEAPAPPVVPGEGDEAVEPFESPIPPVVPGDGDEGIGVEAFEVFVPPVVPADADETGGIFDVPSAPVVPGDDEEAIGIFEVLVPTVPVEVDEIGATFEAPSTPVVPGDDGTAEPVESLVLPDSPADVDETVGYGETLLLPP